MKSNNGGNCPGGCAGPPCLYEPETVPRVLPILGWTIYSDHKGLRLRFPNGSSDYPSPRERQVVLAFEQYADLTMKRGHNYPADRQVVAPRVEPVFFLVVDKDKIAQDESRMAIRWHGESLVEARDHADENEDLAVFAEVPEGGAK